MKFALDYLRLREPLDSVEPLNSTALQRSDGLGTSWGLTADTDLQLVEMIRFHRHKNAQDEVVSEEKWRGDTPMANVRHWVRAKVPVKGAKP